MQFINCKTILSEKKIVRSLGNVCSSPDLPSLNPSPGEGFLYDVYECFVNIKYFNEKMCFLPVGVCICQPSSCSSGPAHFVCQAVSILSAIHV